MRIVTIARKPLASTTVTKNCLDHQAGALNIDATRIAYRSEADKTPSVGQGDLRREPGVGSEFSHHKKNWGARAVNHEGRWPANVILQHLPECRIIGSRKVKSGTAHRENSGGNTIFSDTKKKPLPNMSYADSDGMETVPDWSCAPECPVAALDVQSGELQSGSGTVKRKSARTREGNRSSAYGSESREEGRPEIFYGDRGGASRFFANVGGKR